jgi:hypothetical protein
MESSVDRIIFEGGISLYRKESGFCTHLNSKGGPVIIHPTQLVETGLRPLLARLQLPTGVPFTLILNSEGREVTRFSAMGLFEHHGYYAFSLDYLTNVRAPRSLMMEWEEIPAACTGKRRAVGAKQSRTLGFCEQHAPERYG